MLGFESNFQKCDSFTKWTFHCMVQWRRRVKCVPATFRRADHQRVKRIPKFADSKRGRVGKMQTVILRTKWSVVSITLPYNASLRIVQAAASNAMGECILQCGGSDALFPNNFGQDLLFLCGCPIIGLTMSYYAACNRPS